MAKSPLTRNSTCGAIQNRKVHTAIGVHPAVGYNDAIHLAPAAAGAIAYLTGLILTFRPMKSGEENPKFENRNPKEIQMRKKKTTKPRIVKF
jgi:hypothetical protein